MHPYPPSLSLVQDGIWYDGASGNDRLYHTVGSVLNGQCLDRASYSDAADTRIDTWSCVSDFHNELFNYTDSTGKIYVKSSNHGANDFCVSAGPCPPSASFPVPSFCEAPCSNTANQTWTWNPTEGTLRLRSQPSLCWTAATSPDEDASITLSPCANPVPASQQWSFGGQNIPTLSSTTEWGTCFGPVNVLLM